MATGSRIYYNQEGTIVSIHNEIDNVTIERPEEVISYVDIPYGELKLDGYLLKGVDVDTGELIKEKLDLPETPEQQRIRQLEEDIILLQAEAELGGIL